jgi:hypothetical protein
VADKVLLNPGTMIVGGSPGGIGTHKGGGGGCNRGQHVSRLEIDDFHYRPPPPPPFF